MEIQYRIATLDDLEAICDLCSRARNTLISNQIFQWDEIYPAKEHFREDIDKKQLYAGIVKDRIAVIYVINRECDEQYIKGDWKYDGEPYEVIHRLCVNPDFQNQGIAHRTMLHIEEQLASRGIHSIRLDAFTGNPYALRLYENLGYDRVGTVNWRKGRFYLMEKRF